MNAFLKQFQQESTGLFETLRTDPAPEELVARYIFSKKYYSIIKKSINGRAFEPSSADNSTSVYRILELDNEKIWILGQTYVASKSGRTMHARADVEVNIIIHTGVDVSADEPPPRHAVIHNWPTEKYERMSIAQQIAAEARLVVYTDSVS